jgi:hypothetical protein
MVMGMKTALAFTAAVAAAIVAATAAAAQTDGGRTSRPVEAVLSGLQTSYSSPYAAETLTLTGTYRSPVLGAGTFVVHAVTESAYAIECPFCSSAPVPLSGTAELSAERGTLTGAIGPRSTVVYSEQPHGVSYDLVLRLELDQGSRAFGKVNAELGLTYSAGINFSGPAPEEWAFGSLTGFVMRAEP